MVALIFLLVIGAVFATILALEGGDEHFERRPAGLLTWIASGNWPAKIGGGLMIVGVGALLRYAAINFDIPPSVKVGIGIAATVLLAIGSFLTANNPQRRAVSLAFGGAAFGVAYLTAYSAFALFGYLPTLQGLGLLALTAVGAGVFAVSRSALSLAVLSMVGAFMAPAFAVDDPGPQVVYRYYVAVSVLTLVMVSVRGWRPLIHLSFLFTLAGSAFFAWTADYFSRGNADVLLPLVVMLVAVHVAMPLVERRWTRGRVVESLDTVYLLALPAVAALTVLAIAPSRAALSVELWWFAGIWFAASAWLYSQQREGMATHAIIGLLLLGFGLAARFRDMPWELIALAIGVVSLALAARRSTSTRLHGFLAGLVLVLGAVHMISALAPSNDDTLFLNGRFFERLIGAGLLIVAATTLARLKHTLDSLVLTVAIGWAAFTVGAEVARLELVSAWLLLHWTLVLAGFALFVLARRWPAGDRFAGPLVLAIGLSAVLAQLSTSLELSWVSALVAGCSLLAIALRPPVANGVSSPGPLLAAVGAPLVVAVWMARVARLAPDAHWQLPLSVAAGFALLVMLAGERVRERSERWFNEATDIFAVAFTFVLAAATIFDIGRDLAAAILELICVAALILVASWNGKRVRVGNWILPVAVIGVALVLQANLLRWLGPPDGKLTALSVAKMNWPTLVSLLWASIGAALTISARRVGSRVQWSAGAAFLVGAAIKLLLLDFGSLGQLANILAVIAAGGVFLLVGWLSPMPPAHEVPRQAEPAASEPAASGTAASGTAAPPPMRSAAQPSAAAAGAPGALEMPEAYWHSRPKAPPPRQRSSSDRFAWTVAIAAIILITLSQCGVRIFRGPFGVGRILPSVMPPQQTQTGQIVGPAEQPTDDSRSIERMDADAMVTVTAAAVAAAEAPPTSDECERWVAQLPEDYEVHLVTAVAGASQEDSRRVQLDAPGRNVVLVLMATRSYDWTVSSAPGSRLVGVWVASTHEQQLHGVPDDVARLSAAQTTDGCARVTDASISSTPEVARRVLNRDIASSELAQEHDWALVGQSQTSGAAN